MPTNINFHQIAQDNNLSYVETTSEGGGYPRNIQPAIIDFDSFEQAEDFANQHGLALEFVEKKDGWRLWYRTGNTAYEAIMDDEDNERVMYYYHDTKHIAIAAVARNY